MAELDFSRVVEDAGPDCDLKVVATAEGWVMDLDAEYGSRFLTVNVIANLYGNQLGVGPHNWFYTPYTNRSSYEMFGKIYDTRSEAMQEALEHLNWLVPHALSSESSEFSIQNTLDIAKKWQDIRYMLGYNWNDFPTNGPSRKDESPGRIARLEKELESVR